MNSLLLASYFDNLMKNLGGAPTIWTIIGFAGNLTFASRFIVQWYVSEKLKRSVIPIQFWYLSIVGSILSLAYAIYIGKMPIILGFAFPTIVYVRNLMLIASGKKKYPTEGDAAADKKDAP